MQNTVTTTKDEVVAEMKKLEKEEGDMPQEPRKSERTRKPPVRPMTHRMQCVSYQLCEIDVPSTIQEAKSSEHAAESKVATDSEYNSLIENKTWKLVELTPGQKAIGCKWVFKLKHAADSAVERFKACLVVKGYTQKYGIDYDKTFSPVVRFSAVVLLLAFAVQSDLLIHQMDVKPAFLNGKLDEEIYMQQPGRICETLEKNIWIFQGLIIQNLD